MTAPTRPTTCPQGHPIEWLADDVNIGWCDCQVWRWVSYAPTYPLAPSVFASDVAFVAKLLQARAERDAALALLRDARKYMPEQGDEPEQPDHTCVLGITPCDGICVDWNNWHTYRYLLARMDRMLEQKQ